VGPQPGSIFVDEFPSNQSDVTNCSKCGQPVNGKFCTNCGTPIESTTPKTCPKCGKVVEGKFCSECGTAI